MPSLTGYPRPLLLAGLPCSLGCVCAPLPPPPVPFAPPPPPTCYVPPPVQLVDNAKEHNEKDGATRRWGGGVMGLKTQRRLEKRAKAIAAEAAKKAML